jgi:hypothetical protein
VGPRSGCSARRVVFKAEVLAKGPTTRFVVTDRTAPAEHVYDDYVARGAAENRIKDLKSSAGPAYCPSNRARRSR